ncbi:MAG: L-histidine N(alpha)-methyltransferase [Actinomycetes bacterium]
MSTGRVVVDVLLTPDDLRATLVDDVRRGLSTPPFHLPPKWFYDQRGSELFDRITTLPEYYPTEAERAALRGAVGSLVARANVDTIVELGSGSSDKTRVLLDAFTPTGVHRYVPFDVSESALRDAAVHLVERYPTLFVHAVVGDFDQHLRAIPQDGDRLLAFLGGTLGNYPPDARAQLLNDVAGTLRGGEWLLLGVDLVKRADRITAAYNDAAGVTAAFNRNVLEVLNRELDANFDPLQFEHVAVWNAEHEWIEMRLRSIIDATYTVTALNLDVTFAAGSDLLTEISAKFRIDRLHRELSTAGFRPDEWWTDPSGSFALVLAERDVTAAP